MFVCLFFVYFIFILYEMDSISHTITRTVMKFGRKVVFDKTLKMVEVKMTLSQGQGHRVNLYCSTVASEHCHI